MIKPYSTTRRPGQSCLMPILTSGLGLLIVHNLAPWPSKTKLLMRIQVNILGLQWNTAADTLSFPPKTIIPDNITLTTKREVLQQSSKIFDQLGFLRISCDNLSKTVHAISLAKIHQLGWATGERFTRWMAYYCKGHLSCYHSDHTKTVFYQCKSIICHSTSRVCWCLHQGLWCSCLPSRESTHSLCHSQNKGCTSQGPDSAEIRVDGCTHCF